MMFVIPDGVRYFCMNVMYDYENKFIFITPESQTEIINNYTTNNYILSSNIIQRPFDCSSGNLLMSFGDSITAGVTTTSSNQDGNIVNPDTGHTY